MSETPESLSPTNSTQNPDWKPTAQDVRDEKDDRKEDLEEDDDLLDLNMSLDLFSPTFRYQSPSSCM